MKAMLECCCGVDVHRDMIQACILKGLSEEPEVIKMQFKTVHSELSEFIQWLKHNNCMNIAMESTGVYWRPIYESIETNLGYEQLFVVNARHMRNLPGRKSDVKDAQWIATLFRYGLLEASFVPDRITRLLREYSRIYKTMIQERTRIVNRLEKFLQGHGFKLSSVMSDITGTSGRNLLNILAQNGRILPQDVVAAINRHLRKPVEEIRLAVCGTLQPAEQRLLQFFLERLDAVDRDIQRLLFEMEQIAQPYKLALEQMDSIPGINLTAALSILAEIGPAPSEKFKTAQHLCSWAGLVPRNDESAGKIKSRKTLHGNPYIKSILCQSAWACVRSRKSPLAAWFWSHQVKLGRKKAIIAVARRILTLIFKLLQTGDFFQADYCQKYSVSSG